MSNLRMRVLEFRVEIWWAKCLSAKDVDGRTPLHYCVSAGHDRSVLEALICIRGNTTATTGASSSDNHNSLVHRKNPKSDIGNVQKSMSRSSSNGVVMGSNDSLRGSSSGSMAASIGLPSRGVGTGGDNTMMVERGRGRFYDDNPGNRTTNDTE